MTTWTVWDPGAGLTNHVGELAAALARLSTNFGDAGSDANSAASTADKMTAESVQKWASLVRAFGRDANSARQSLASLATALQTYADAVSSIKTLAQHQRAKITRSDVRWFVSSRLGEQSVSLWEIDVIANAASDRFDQPSQPGGAGVPPAKGETYWLVEAVATELSWLAIKRAKADKDVITAVQAAVPTTTTLFGVRPHLSGDTPGWSWSLGAGADAAGVLFNEESAIRQGFQAAVGAFEGGESPQWAKGFGVAGGAMGAAAGAFGAAQGISQIVAWAHGENVSFGEAAGATVSGLAGLAGGVASIAEAAGKVLPGGLVPGLGLVASVPGVISSYGNMTTAWNSGSTADKVGTTMSFVGNCVSMVGSLVPPPGGLIVSGVGALLSGAGSLISKFWSR